MSNAPNFNAEYDLIVAGGGTAAGVLVGRLLAAAPSLRILMLEAGPSTRDKDAHVQPGRFMDSFTSDSSTIKFHKSKPSEALAGRELDVPCGQCLGGGSSVNFLMYVCASKSDYDVWEKDFGNEGWGSQALIPLLKKTETYQPQPDAPTHGCDGPLKVSYGGQYTNVGKEFLDVTRAFDHSRQTNDIADPNDLETINVYTRWPKWIDGDTGRRSDVPHHFIYPQDSNPNLTVLTGVYVQRVIFDTDNRTSGAQFIWNPRFHPGANEEIHAVKATRLVVIAAGTFGSPGILERSGIGKTDVLERAGIHPRVELSGVGEGYQDHNFLCVPYKAAEEAETLDGIARNDSESIARASEQWKSTGKGLMAHSSLDAGFKMRPLASELDMLGPRFQRRWEDFYALKPDKPLLWIGVLSMSLLPPALAPLGKYFTMASFTTYPISRGSVHITHADNVDTPLNLTINYLEDMADVVPLMWAYKHTREIARRMPLFRGELAPFHPIFSSESGARVVENSDGPLDAPRRIQYTEDDDRVLKAYIRAQVTATAHGMGTCSMKPREQGGVVNHKLDVYGVSGLKVVDMSISPGNVGANTYSTALVIGEKAAIIVAEELGISGV
ncbi:GMC oxidoreductase [Auriscalpium vulgare]|uniref:GMC oxidoreductase n=1 Tax=Auriscalpium vulgare TaxID=40419 RepID=A0ACB8RGW3_9AGAM|nr:GMC oxidoreductase [Auriscalpium vulgare]